MISSIYRNVNDGPAKRAVCATRKRAGRVTKPNHDAQFKHSTNKNFWSSYTRKIEERLQTRS